MSLTGLCLLLTMLSLTQSPVTNTHDSLCHLVLADYSTSEMLVNMGNLPLDEFYPAVSMVALMRIFRDQSLSHHHTMVVQAITFIFKSLGLKCVQFLPQVMPTFLNVIRVCDGAIREVSAFSCRLCSAPHRVVLPMPQLPDTTLLAAENSASPPLASGTCVYGWLNLCSAPSPQDS